MEPLTPTVSNAPDEQTLPPQIYTPPEGEPVPIGSPAGTGDGMPLVTLPVKLPPPMTPTEKTVDNRSFKTTYGGLAELIGQSEETVKTSIASGQEDWIRREAASRIDVRNAELRNQKIKQMAAIAGRPLDPAEVQKMLDPFHPQYGAARPDDVIERAYATQYVSSMNTAEGYMQDNYVSQARQEIPQQLDDTIAKTSTLAARREFVQTKAQDIQDAIEKQGYVGWGADQIKLLAQPYSEIKLRGLIKEVGALDGGLLLGNNVEKTVDALMDMPGPQFQATVTNLLAKMKDDNPTLALMFAQTILGATTSEKNLNNVFTVLAPLDITGAAGATRKLATKVGLFNKLQEGYRGIAKSLEVEKPTRATIAEAAGNLNQSATMKAADDLIKGNDGTLGVTTTARESLMTGFRQDVEKLGQNTGSFTREAVTRIQDGIIRGGDSLLIETEQRAKVERLPTIMAAEDRINLLRSQEAANYRGPKNTLLDIGDPVKNDITNTWHWPVRIGGHGNTLLNSEEAAANFARDELKLADFKIGKREGLVETQAAGLTGSKTDLATIARLEKSIPKIEEAIHKAEVTSKDIRIPMHIRKTAADSLRGTDGFKSFLKKYNQELQEAKSRLKPTASIKQQGIGYYIERTVPLNENQSLVKDLMIKNPDGTLIEDAIGTSSASGFESLRNGVFGWFRGANQTMSKNEMMQRNAVAFSTTAMRKWTKDESQALTDIARGKIRNDEVTGEPIPWHQSAPRPITGDLSRAEVKEQFTRTLKHAQDAHDPDTKQIGYFFKTLGDLEDHYLRFFQRRPSFNEANAYFSYVKLVEAERVLMEISEYKYRARVGAEQHQFWFRDGKNKINSGFIDGVDKKELPGGSDNMLVLGDVKGDEKMYKTSAIDSKTRAKWEQEIQSGQSKVIQIYASGQRPLKDFSDVAGNERIVYVLARNVETKPLEYNHVSRRGGGHFDLDYDNNIKQPIMTHSRSGDVEADKRGGRVESLYEGDRTYVPVDNRAMGKDITKKLNEVVALLDKKEYDLAKAKYLEHKLPQEWEKFKAMFLPTKLGDKVVLPRYSTKERFEVVPKGMQIADLNKDLQKKYEGTFRDGTRSGDLSKQFQVEYNKERDAERVYAISDKGSPGRPDYEYQPASLVDPMATFDRSLSRMINSTFMDDYKIFTVENWLREASDYLKPSESELRAAPFAHFVTPEWKSGLATHDLAKMSNLMSNRYKAREFIGLPSKFDTMMYQLQQTVADSVWSTENKLGRSALMVPHWLLPYHAEPVSAMRTAAFDMKLGLYALPQVFTQVNSWATTIALEPRAGAAGTYAALLHSWASLIPKHLDSLDAAATKIDMGKIMLGSSRWKLGEFKEAYKELGRSGFANVGGEMADLDNLFARSGIMNGTNTFRETGRKPYQWGEKAARIPAYYTAFRKFREENPFGAITDLDRQKILYQANILTNNMTRASNSIMNEGVLSMPMQFLSYQYRLGETFFGKEIGETASDRAMARVRLMATYGALYGIPSAVGVTGIPYGDNIRRFAVDTMGYVPGENWYSTAVMEGWPSLFLGEATGNSYDISGKWGTKGMTTVDDLLRGDKTWLQILGGAGFDNAYKFISGFDGWYKAMISFARQDPDGDKKYKITVDDLIKPALEISSANTLRQMIVGVNLGKRIAKDGTYVADVSAASAVFMGITGLQPTEQAYQWDKAQIRKEEIAMQKDAFKSFQQDMARAEMSAANKDPDQAMVYTRNAFSTLMVAGYPTEKIFAAIAIARKNSQGTIDRTDWDFGLGDAVPMEKREGRKDQYIRTQQLKGNAQ